ncbi:hypothetical protein BSLG_009694 [Batrachochytrium salamandrivorans]|nr:hypothetical protein BSLG_009694 [Batrachochytrium salamandrivorans]
MAATSAPTPAPTPTPSTPVALKPTSSPVDPESFPGYAPGLRTERRTKINRMRARIAERLKESQNTAATLTTFNEVDMSNLMEMRSKFKDIVLEKHGVKLGFMSAFVKAAVHGLQAVPAVNARMEADEIVYHDFVDISVAVATPKGLVTPIVRNCESLSMVQARDGLLSLEDMSGGTFTISNGVCLWIAHGNSIINQPQSAILGMHAVKDRAVVVNGQVVVRPMMYLALTYDHRLIDGREATYVPRQATTVCNRFCPAFLIDYAQLARKWRINSDLVYDLCALALYDIVFYVDDSGSMAFEEKGERIDDLKFIVSQTAEMATLFDDDGVQVRFMNSDIYGEGIRTAVQCLLRLGLHKPVLAIVITDGEPTREPLDTLRTVIMDAKRLLGHTPMGTGSLAVQIGQVGTDVRAQEFLASLDNDPVVGGMIDCTSNHEMESAEIGAHGHELTPEMWLLKLCLGAIDRTYDDTD